MRRLAGLPVHDGRPTVRVGEDRVDAATHHSAADGHLEGHLDGQRCTRGPLRGEEGLLQRGQLLGVALRDVGVRGARQVGEVEKPLCAIKALDPVVKYVAQQRMRFRPHRQSTHQPLCGVLGITGQVDQAADGQSARQRWCRRVRGAGTLAEQRVDIGRPPFAIGVGRR